MSRFTILHPQTQAEFDRWDAFVMRHPQGRLYQLSWWLRCQERRFLRSGVVAVCRGETIVAGAACVRFGLSWSCANVTVVANAPLVDADTPDSLAALLGGLVNDCRANGSLLLQLEAFEAGLEEPIRAYFGRRSVVHEPIWRIYSPGIWREVHVPLAGRSENDILNGVSQTVRYGIKKAQNAGIDVRQVFDEEGIRAAHAIWVESVAKHPYPIRSYHDFRRIVIESNQRGVGVLLLASIESEPAAFVFSILFGCGAHWLHGGFTQKHAAVPCTRLLVWRTVQMAMSKGIPYLCLGGPSDRARTGVQDFKDRWNPVLVDNQRFITVPLYPELVRAAKPFISNPRVGVWIKKRIGGQARAVAK